MTLLTSENLELRLLPESDLPTLLKVYQGTPLYFDALGVITARLTFDQVRTQWLAAQANPQRHLFGVYHIVTGLLIGAADVEIGSPQPQAAAVWLLIWGGFQRQGYGQDCMAMLETWLLNEQGVETLFAIASANEEGVSFLELQGFNRTGETAQPPIASGPAFWMAW
jgi:RimJ/RimL family protein N-acetyltransferase